MTFTSLSPEVDYKYEKTLRHKSVPKQMKTPISSSLLSVAHLLLLLLNVGIPASLAYDDFAHSALLPCILGRSLQMMSFTLPATLNTHLFCNPPFKISDSCPPPPLNL